LPDAFTDEVVVLGQHDADRHGNRIGLHAARTSFSLPRSRGRVREGVAVVLAPFLRP
jgi:hypothetical protein